MSVIGLRNRANTPKYIYTDDIQIAATNINGYLADADSVFVVKRTKPLSEMPTMSFGSMPNDNGALILSPEERCELLESAPEADRFVKSFLGASE
ncbi:hypothetical protein BLIN101_03282 [Brevibacterium linens]|uniref:MmeI-like target recognition domain-containing protein n=1 Tax=Brevibacterium linens TaxID=1703 RepID=A0A2H1KF22_BRELN|nr:hypothetical protein BLIN101_03282 [Brevibacterium linens]